VGAALAVCDDVVADLLVDDRALVLLFADASLWSLLLPLLRNNTHTTATIAPNRITLRTAMTVNAVRDEPVGCAGIYGAGDGNGCAPGGPKGPGGGAPYGGVSGATGGVYCAAAGGVSNRAVGVVGDGAAGGVYIG
jgi:hypothetical protein